MQDKSTQTGAESRDLKATLLERRWEAAGRLPCALSAELDIPGVTIGKLLDLSPGSVLNSHCLQPSSIFLWVNGVNIGRGEVEVSGDFVAIRITEIR